MQTLLLDQVAWDLAIDAAGNIAVASTPYALAQDAASAIKLFKGEYIYDVTLGIPYFEQVLGQAPSLNLMRSLFNAAALTVPGVQTAACFFTSVTDGNIAGQVQVTDINGNVSIASF